MRRLNRNGFTLVELIATIVLLSIVMVIASYSVIAVMKNSREKDYNLLIENINSAVENYYIECKYAGDTNTCQSQITLGYLVTNGYIKGNKVLDGGNYTLINPKDQVNISACRIRYTYNSGKVVITAVDTAGSCPDSY